MSDFKQIFTPVKVEKVEYRSIQLDRHIILKGGRQTKFIKPGDQVRVKEGILAPCYGEPSHIVVSCFGTIESREIEIELFEIETKETVTIKL